MQAGTAGVRTPDDGSIDLGRLQQHDLQVSRGQLCGVGRRVLQHVDRRILLSFFRRALLGECHSWRLGDRCLERNK